MKRKLLLALVLGSAPAWGKPYEPQIQPIEVPPPIVLPTMAPPTDVPNRPLTANEAARLALRHQTNIAVAQGQVKAAQGNVEQARSGLRPQLSVGASYTDVVLSANSSAALGTGLPGASSAGIASASVASSAALASTTLNSTSMTANIRQLLFDFQRTRNLVRQAEEVEKATQANCGKVEMDTILAVKASFYSCLQTRRLIKVQEQNVDNQREHLKQAQARFRAGLGLPSDVTRSQTAVANAVYNLTQARSDAEVARINLALQMGLDPRTPLELDEAEEAQTAVDDPAKLFEVAVRQRPEVQGAEANMRATFHGLSAASSLSAPVVSLNFSYTGRVIEGIPQTNGINLVFAINWTAYDGGLQDGAVKTAEGNVDSAKAQLEGTVRAVIAEVAQDYYKLKTAEQKLQDAIIEEANAAETVRLAEGRYKVGLGILLDVLDAQSALLTAQTNRINSQTQISVARSTLMRAIGKPLEG